ncbi:O-methyltransferase involved in polyketide biosynthesis [Catenulispora sp. GP43]|uniref:SAM-dependent methyltransferase n=1 Tax=Catenulispora sp. GP43 TaxID=3156263 RepID=UPI003517F9F9
MADHVADHAGLGPLPPLFDTPQHWRPAALDTDTPHVARVYDYLLGGKDHFRTDRAAAELLLRANPYLRDACREQRDFLRRAVRHLAAEGVSQFVDIGTGLPAAPTAHQIARAVQPAARVAYVDNDPIVLSHARVLLTDGGPGTAFVEGDLREPEALLREPALRAVIDLGEPVAMVVTGLLHFLPDHEQPAKHVRTLMDACAPGSCLVLTHGASDLAVELARATSAAFRQAAIPCQARSRDEVLELVGELELAEPGLVPMAAWRPERNLTKTVRERQIAYGVVARKG